MRLAIAVLAAFALAAPARALDPVAPPKPEPMYLVVLGNAQDGGAPQAGSHDEPGWHDPARHRYATSLAIVDDAHQQRWLFEATPDFPAQLQALDEIAPRSAPKPALDGIFLTHAHMGHYTGLMWLGKEVMGADRVPVYAMPRMAQYLRTNGPWSQLVKLSNIELHEMGAGQAVPMPGFSVTPLLVPHRQEYSEVVGFRIEAGAKKILFIPDIDSWTQWDETGTRIEDEIAKVDVAYLDGTFFANGEIPGRDMSGFPHPFIRTSMDRFSGLPALEKAKVRFIHLNHTNHALWPGTPERAAIEAAGFRVAEQGERVPLSAAP